ncbi:hypothetical protein [Brevibacillus parabrevis]|uniref:hypothetical protein n=1 Tax=Brevibacillus parabrevis TaxID=54914 RepID=UPI0028536C85|nr:hypothetical protein [Brevibacillus parabrevis]MDR5000430.1 hypothetical protein [Brevibacillus parabrevis]
MFWGTAKNIAPSYGSVVFTELGFGIAEHSGIFVGQNSIIHLNGQGLVERVSLEEFTNHITTFNHEIYVPCYSNRDWSIGFPIAGARATDNLESIRNYNVLLDNCHQFCAGCLTGDFDNANNFLWMLKDLVRKEHGESVTWRKWDWKKAS